MVEAIAEPGSYDPPSAASLHITDAQSLALACRRMRRQAGTSQRAFAVATGVSKTTIALIETCGVDPTLAVLLKLVTTAGAKLQITGLDPTTFVFGIVEEQRDRAERHAPPHRLSDAGFGWWDTSLERPIRKAKHRHQADLITLTSVAAARASMRR
jgi:transcriptional regulator with XRE-family HTH domain